MSKPLEKILSEATPHKTDPAMLQIEADDILDTVRSVTAKPWLMRSRRCLRQGLLGYRYLRLAGREPSLHFGVVPDSLAASRPRAHCWISLKGTIVLNPPEEEMVDLFVHRDSRAHGPLDTFEKADFTDG